jgi:hypothetical protein
MENTIELSKKGKNLFSRLESYVRKNIFLEVEKDYLFRVETTKPFAGYDPGQLIFVEQESEQDYTGVLCDTFQGFYVTVPKNICRRLDDN